MTDKTIGTGGDYSTLQAWEDAKPADIVGSGSIWRGLQKNQNFDVTGSVTPILVIAGSTTDATHYTELTTETGASFRDNASVQSNALKYNASNGASISQDGGSANVIEIEENFFRMSKLQVKGTPTGGSNYPTCFDGLSGTYGGVIIDGCIFETHNTNYVGRLQCASASVLKNCVLAQLGESAGAIFGCSFSTNLATYNNSFVAADDLTTPPANLFNNDFASGYTSKNDAWYGGGTTTLRTSSNGTWTTGFSDCSTVPTGVTGSGSFSGAFQNVNASTQDWRAKTGGNLIDNGTTDSTNAPVDIAGTSRPSGSAYDIGAWELVQAGGSVRIPALLFMEGYTG